MAIDSVPTGSCPQIIETYRDCTRGRSNEELVGEYFKLLAKIEKAGEKGNRSSLIQYCMLSLPFIEPLIRWGTDPSGFRIRSIPAIQELAQAWGQQCNKAQLANLRELVWFFPELEPWRRDIEDAERTVELRPSFEWFFRERRTCLRKDLPKAFPDLPREAVLRVVDDLVEVGVLKTGKAGRFVSVFVAQENPGGTDASTQP